MRRNNSSPVNQPVCQSTRPFLALVEPAVIVVDRSKQYDAATSVGIIVNIRIIIIMALPTATVIIAKVAIPETNVRYH